VVHTDARRRSIPLGKLAMQFKPTAPSKLYWAGRPAMRVVQALHWLKDILATDGDVLNGRRLRKGEADWLVRCRLQPNWLRAPPW
jgi:hypothetical protein